LGSDILHRIVCKMPELLTAISLAAAAPTPTPHTTLTDFWTSPALWVGILSAAVGILSVAATALGWFVIRWREDRQKGIERELKYCERQIEEFYGPLFNLMEQMFAAERVQQTFLDASNDQEDKIRTYFQENYFLPFHSEIIQILKGKLYLVEGANVPSSFPGYLEHACDERTRRALNIWPQISFRWPTDFERHLTDGLRAVMTKYDGLIKKLETFRGHHTKAPRD
jgi:hypothetical protein